MDAIRLAKLIAIPAPFFLAGYATQASHGALPSLFDKPAATSVASFSNIFYWGAYIVAPGIALSAGATGYLAYAQPAQRNLWIAAGALAFAPLPFTQLFMMGGIRRLLHLDENAAEREKSEKSGEVLSLLKAWTNLNYFRVASYAASGAIAIWLTIA